MRHWKVLGPIALAVVLIVGAGYWGLRAARSRPDPDLEALQSPPVVKVSRGTVQQTVIAPGMLVDVWTVVLDARVSGALAELTVRPGDAVEAGQVVARARVDDLPRQIEQAESELDSARLALSTAKVERTHQIALLELDLAAARAQALLARADRQDALDRAERALAVAQEQQARLETQAVDRAAGVAVAGVDVAQAEDELARAQVAYQQALDRPWEPQQVRDAQARALVQAERALTIAQARHEQALAAQAAYQHDLNLGRLAIAEAEAERARLDAYTDPLPAIEVQRIQQQLDRLNEGVDPLLADRVKRAEMDLDHLRARLTDTQVVAPMAGVVTQVSAQPGDAVVPGTELMRLSDPSALEVQTTVIEEDLPLIRVGQPADLFFDAQPEALIQGAVTRIVPQRVVGEDRPLYYVYVAPDGDLPAGLYPGMTVDASIVIARRTDVLRLPRALVQTCSDGTAQVRVWLGGLAETRTIDVGLRGDVYVEILGDLHLGDEVREE